MEASTKISFCLPNELDEGACPYSLIHFLVNKHNELVQLVDEALLLRAKRSHHELVRAKAISHRFLTSAHCFDCPIEEFSSFLEKQCITMAAPGYDYGKAENRLISSYMSNLPAIDYKQEFFVYTREQKGTLDRLNQKLSQEELLPETVVLIKGELVSPAAGQKLLEMVEIVIDFLCSTGGPLTFILFSFAFI